MTGGVAGIAFILSHHTEIKIGTLFVAGNIPSFLLASQRTGMLIDRQQITFG